MAMRAARRWRAEMPPFPGPPVDRPTPPGRADRPGHPAKAIASRASPCRRRSRTDYREYPCVTSRRPEDLGEAREPLPDRCELLRTRHGARAVARSRAGLRAELACERPENAAERR